MKHYSRYQAVFIFKKNMISYCNEVKIYNNYRMISLNKTQIEEDSVIVNYSKDECIFHFNNYT